MTCRHAAGTCTNTFELLVNGPEISPARCGACPSYDGPARGLGDMIASATKAVGVKPCAQCQSRREALNQILPNPFKPG